MLQTLAERNFPADKVHALASSRSAGREVSYGEDDVLTIGALDKFDFGEADIALFSAGGDTSQAVARRQARPVASSSTTRPPSAWKTTCR